MGDLRSRSVTSPLPSELLVLSRWNSGSLSMWHLRLSTARAPPLPLTCGPLASSPILCCLACHHSEARTIERLSSVSRGENECQAGACPPMAPDPQAARYRDQ